MTVADDLIAVRTLLLLRGRAVGAFTADDGSLCLRQAMIDVSRASRYADTSAFEDPGWKAFKHDEDCDLDWMTYFSEPVARDVAMWNVLLKYLPQDYQDVAQINPYSPEGADPLALYNDDEATDQDVLNVIEKALAELGALG